MIARIVAVIIIIGLIISIFGKWSLYVFGFFILLYGIRLGADIYWWWRDR